MGGLKGWILRIPHPLRNCIVGSVTEGKISAQLSTTGAQLILVVSNPKFALGAGVFPPLPIFGEMEFLSLISTSKPLASISDQNFKKADPYSYSNSCSKSAFFTHSIRQRSFLAYLSIFVDSHSAINVSISHFSFIVHIYVSYSSTENNYFNGIPIYQNFSPFTIIQMGYQSIKISIIFSQVKFFFVLHFHNNSS